MRTFFTMMLLAFVGFNICAIEAQSVTPRATTAIPPRKLTDNFAVASLRALKAINGETAKLEMRGNDILVPRATQELIDDADAQGQTDDDKKIVTVLNLVLMQRLSVNTEYFNATYMYDFGEPMTQKIIDAMTAAASKDEKLQAETVQFNGCSTALESVLRSRTFVGTPAECSHLLSN